MKRRPGIMIAGAALVARRRSVLWGLYLLNLALALCGTASAFVAVGSVLDRSLASGALTGRFEFLTFLELLARPEISLAQHLPAALLFALLFFAAVLFLTGGVVDAYLFDDLSLDSARFFSACTRFFLPFLRLLLVFMLALIPVMLLSAAVRALASAFAERTLREGLGRAAAGGAFAFQVLLLMGARVCFDVVQLRAVSENERRIRRVLIPGLRLAWSQFGRLLWLYARTLVVALLGVGLAIFLWTRVVRPEWTAATFLLGQFVALLLLATRLLQRAAGAVWYRQACPAPVAAVELVFHEQLVETPVEGEAPVEPEPKPIPDPGAPEPGLPEQPPPHPES